MVVLAKGTKRLTKGQNNVRDYMMKQAQRDAFQLSDEEWAKMQSEKIAEENAKIEAYNKKSLPVFDTKNKTFKKTVAVVHKKNGEKIVVKK